MSSKPSYSFLPPDNTPFESPEDFIRGAGKTIKEVIKERVTEEVLPWESSTINPKHRVLFNVRFPQTYYEKIKWLSAKEKESLHKIVEDILYPGIDKAISKIRKNEELKED